MGPLAILVLAAGGIAVAAAAGGAAPSGPTGSDWRRVARIFPATPPPPPFYAPNIAEAKAPLVMWAFDGETQPVPYNSAIDVRGQPWVALRITATAWPQPGTIGLQALKDATLGEVMDPTTRQWVSVTDALVGTHQWYPASWSAGPDFTDRVIAATQKYFIPWAITLAGTAIGGVGGALAAGALQAVWNIANGMKVTDAMIDAYQQRLATAVEKTAYYQTYQSVVSTYKQTKADLDAIRAQAMKLYGYDELNQKTVAEAINAAMGVARSKQLQDAGIAAVRMRAGDPYAAWMDESLAHGVQLADWVIAMYGSRGAELLQWAYRTANAALDAGRDPIAAVAPQLVIQGVLGKVTTAGSGRQLAASRRRAA